MPKSPSDQSESASMRELLREIAMAGVSYDEPRVGYVEVQIDRATWQELQDWRAADILASDEDAR